MAWTAANTYQLGVTTRDSWASGVSRSIPRVFELCKSPRPERQGIRILRILRISWIALELTRFGGHLTVPDTEVFSEWIIEKA